MRKPELNVKLLRKVIRHIKKDPRRFNMGRWFRKVPENVAPCGTQGCIAGWAVFLSLKAKERGNVDQFAPHELQEKARRLCGLTPRESDQLFLGVTSGSGEEGVKIAERRIKALIKDRDVLLARGYRSHVTPSR